MIKEEYQELGPLSRSIRMNNMLSRIHLSCGPQYTRSSRELANLAEVAPLMAIEYAAAESQYRFSLKDTSGKAVKTFDVVDRGVLREKTSRGSVYWIDTASGRYVSTKGDYFEFVLKDPEDDIRADLWHLRKYGRNGCWKDIRRDGDYMHYLDFEAKSNGAVYCLRKVTKNGKIISLKKNGKPVPFVSLEQNGGRNS